MEGGAHTPEALLPRFPVATPNRPWPRRSDSGANQRVGTRQILGARTGPIGAAAPASAPGQPPCVGSSSQLQLPPSHSAALALRSIQGGPRIHLTGPTCGHQRPPVRKKTTKRQVTWKRDHLLRKPLLMCAVHVRYHVPGVLSSCSNGEEVNQFVPPSMSINLYPRLSW